MAKNFETGIQQRAYAELPEMAIVKNFLSETDLMIHVPAYPALSDFFNTKALKTVYLTPPLDEFFNRTIKRTTDLIIAVLVIIFLLSWITPLMAILIKLTSRGPVFFLQKRNKRKGDLFTCIKFRSMFVNSDADILPAGKHDKRITRLGKFLRNHYLDELPQFFNVLIGDMSVVGPRPHMVSDNLKYEEQVNYYGYRHSVKPGITGLAQVMGYVGAADNIDKMRERVNMDIFYLRHWSFKLDITILLRTFGRSFR
ncbi:MAG: sugar transferase [Ferruginibacter sp.]